MRDRSYVPALSFDWLTPLYDPLLALTLREAKLKGRLIDQAGIEAGHDVLDVGCGTGTLAILVKTRVPGARVVGLDRIGDKISLHADGIRVRVTLLVMGSGDRIGHPVDPEGEDANEQTGGS